MIKQTSLKPVKYINDPVYGGIPITAMELELISTPVFQRLRGLRQLARVNYVFPGAEHSRFVHSLGVLYIMGLMTDHLMKDNPDEFTEDDAVKMRAAALLHDIGHYPFSHLGESVYNYCTNDENASSLFEEPESAASRVVEKVPLYELASSHKTVKSAHHEHLGKYIVINNVEISTILENYGLDPLEIGEIFTGEIGSRNMVYTQLLHSSLDADRLDYLLRDSYQTGVKYGLVDLQYLIRLLKIVKDPKQDCNVLVCNKKGQHVVEHFLMSRYFHYSQVIFHKTNAAFEGMIKCMFIKLVQNGKFIYSSLDEIQRGINEETFLNFTDSFLEVAFEKFYKETDDEEYKILYKMYQERIRPKVVFELKDLYEESPAPEFSVLKWQLTRYPESITNLLKTDKWGYQNAFVRLEKIHSHFPMSEIIADHEEDMREAVKLYDINSGKISYLAEDKLSVINRISPYKNEFIRIYVFDKENEYDHEKMHQDILLLIQSKK